MKKPKISICVPVHNVERFLPYFLDSVLVQTFDDYEVVLADNHSTDHSLEILHKYEQAFPDRIFVFEAEKRGGAGVGRNLSFQKSRGDYIFWCDSDDLVHPSALESFYREAVKYDADVVCGSAFELDEKDGEIIRFFPIMDKQMSSVTTETLIADGTHFWTRMIKRELIEKMGEMPYEDIFEDVRYLGVLNSYAKNIRYLDARVYYWYKRSTSTTFFVRKELCEDSVQADKYLLSACNPVYLDNIRNFVAFRNYWYLDIYWQYFDIFVDWIREQAQWFYDGSLKESDRAVFDRLCWADHLADCKMKNIVYVNGFRSTPNKSRLEELQNKVFHDGCKIVVLSLENCDLEENPYITRAYRNGDYDCVAGYFALKHIYQDGGIYIDDRIRIINYFGVLKYQNAFFAMIDKTTYSDWIYGAPAENEAIEAILKTYSDQWDKKREYMSLSERISIILTAKYGIPLDGKPRLFGDIVSVFSPDLSVADTRFGSETKKCMFEHDFSAYAQQDEYVTIPRSSLEWMLAHARVEVVERVIRENEDLMSTNTGRLMMKIRRIGDGPYGPFLKKIFHAVLRLYRKIK